VYTQAGCLKKALLQLLEHKYAHMRSAAIKAIQGSAHGMPAGTALQPGRRNAQWPFAIAGAAQAAGMCWRVGTALQPGRRYGHLLARSPRWCAGAPLQPGRHHRHLLARARLVVAARGGSQHPKSASESHQDEPEMM